MATGLTADDDSKMLWLLGQCAEQLVGYYNGPRVGRNGCTRRGGNDVIASNRERERKENFIWQQVGGAPRTQKLRGKAERCPTTWAIDRRVHLCLKPHELRLYIELQY
jgi:hypothetical protein